MKHFMVAFFQQITSLFLMGLFLLSPLILTGQVPQNSTSNTTQRIYVCNQGTASVSIIDVNSLEIIDTLELQDLGFSANAKPHHVVAEPDGSFWYVTLIGENQVLKFNRENDLVGQVELEVPGLMSLPADKDEIYVGRSMSAVNPPQSFGIIRRSDMTLQKEIGLFFARPHALTHRPNDDWTFIGSLSANQILSVNTKTEKMDLSSLGGNTHVFVNFAVSPDGNTMVATAQVTGKFLIFDIQVPNRPSLVKSIDVKAQPWHPIFSADGSFVYFANKGANAVTKVNMNTQEVEAVIEGNGLAQPHGAALSGDGRYLFVSSNNMDGSYTSSNSDKGSKSGTVTVIDTENHTIVKVLEVGANATGLGTRALY